MEIFNFKNMKKLQRVTAMFRFIEICIFFVIISRFSIDFKLSGDYFNGLLVSLMSPWFVFVLGNAIVIVLFLISGQSSAKDSTSSIGKIDMYDEYMESCVKMKKRDIYRKQSKKQSIDGSSIKAKIDEKCVKNRDMYREQSKKQSIGVSSIRAKSDLCDESYVKNRDINRVQSIDGSTIKPKIDSYDEKCAKNREIYGEQSKKQSTRVVREAGRKIPRSHSENSLSTHEKPSRELTRSATVGRRRNGENPASNEMSSEDFRRTIEAFIARQQRLLKEEEFSADVSCEA